MKNNYSIIIDSTDGLISIPFKNLEQIDNFTAHFENSKTIAITLIDVFNLNIKKENVRHISVNKNFQIKGKEINKNLPIILSNDIYDEEKIKKVIVDFIIKEEARECLEMIETIHYSIVGLNTLSGESFKNNILYHLDKITYEELRKAYFILKTHGYYVPKEIPNTFKTIDIQDLNIVDNYLSHLITSLNQADEETASKIIEELASYDLEYLKETLPHNQKPVIDGLIETENTPNIKEIIRYLEMVNNLSIEEQAKLIEYIKPKKIKKIKKDPGNKQWA